MISLKYVRLDGNNKVVEILPESTYGLGIEHWYGQEFASHCVSAPDNIQEGLYYQNGAFIEREEQNQREATELEKLEAQVMYTALMTDTLIENEE